MAWLTGGEKRRRWRGWRPTPLAGILVINLALWAALILIVWAVWRAL